MLLPLVAGLLAGLLGVIPFLHTNLLLEFLKGLFTAQGLAVFAVALSFSHSVFEVIPAVFLFVPTAHSLSMLPAHSLALEGKSMLAAKTILHASFYSFLAALLLLPLAVVALPLVFEEVSPFTPGILALLVAASLFLDKKKVLEGSLVFVVSGVFGLVLFSFPLLKEPLLPLLTGLFGIPSVLLSLNSRRVKTGGEAIPAIKKSMIAGGVVLGMLSPLLPAVSPAFLSGLAFAFFESTPLGFLQLNTALVSSKLLYDTASVFLIGKTRSGSAAVIKEASLGTDAFMLTIIAGAIAFFASLAAMTIFSRKLPGATGFFGYKANLALLATMVAGILAYSGPLGLFVTGVATCIGLLPSFLGTRRSHAMGALMAPSLAYSLGFGLEFARLVKSF